MTSLRKHLLAAGLVAAFGAGAIAQTPPSPPAGGVSVQVSPHAGEHTEHHQQRQARKAQRMQERLAMRLAYLKERLQITPAQEGAWAAFTAGIQPQRVQGASRAEFRGMTTPQRIDHMAALRDARTTILERRGEAAKAFYAQLSAPQRQVFDEMSLRLLGGGQGGKRGGPGHHRHHRG